MAELRACKYFCTMEMPWISGMPVIRVVAILCYVLFSAKKTPFNIRFTSDHWEFVAGDGMKTPNGFKLLYKLIAC
jgi:hypothetical protein